MTPTLFLLFVLYCFIKCQCAITLYFETINYIVDSTYYAFSPELEEAIIETHKAVADGTAKVYDSTDNMFHDLDEEADDE